MEATNDDTLEVVRWVTDVPPDNYTFRIESFSLLSKTLQKAGADKYESGDFEVGGYRWRLVMYPNGDPKRDVNDHISLYLEILETNDLPLGWEVHVLFKFIVYDQIRDKYLAVQVARERRFHAMKTKWGIPRLFSLDTFKDPSNGCLIEDCCVFGVDVFVIKREGKGEGESLSMIKGPQNGTFTWKLANFSELKKEFYLSNGFTVGDCQWKLKLYPKGDSRVEGKDNLSLYLYIFDYSVLRPGRKVYMAYKLRIKDQVHDKHFERIVDGRCFCESAQSFGYYKFVSLSDLNDAKKGFLVNDTLIVEVEITLISAVNYFASNHT